MAIPTPEGRNCILQMFNVPFGQIQARLPEINDVGYSHILISPPQRSHPSTEWWGRYQPVDFTIIDGPLGNEQELRSLCDAADAYTIRILADVVLNHMANHPDYLKRDGCTLISANYPRFSTRDFHEIRTASLDTINGWMSCDLPDLRTETRYVRDEARNYLRLLLDIGVFGFRFDAAKHIEVGFFEEVMRGLPIGFSFGEFVEGNPDQIGSDYLQLMDAYDFPLANTMKIAFGYSGDLRMLVNPAQQKRALAGTRAVTFVRHHDIVMHPDWFEFFHISNGVDSLLAMAYLLIRRDGFPFVYLDDCNESIVKAGVLFHNLALRKGEYWVVSERDQLGVMRGNDQLGILNKAGSQYIFSKLSGQPRMQPGTYIELLSGNQMTVQSDGIFPQHAVDSRSVEFYVPFQ